MNPIIQAYQEGVAKFKTTRLCKEGGSCFECSDYEGIVADMEQYISYLTSHLLKAVESAMPEVGDFFVGESDARCEEYRAAALAPLKEALEVINKEA